MNNITDLRFADFPVMTVLMADDTVVHVSAPSVNLIDEIKASRRTLESVLNGEQGTNKLKRAIYDLAAKMINCNEDDFVTTGYELLTRYRWSLRAVDIFFTDYKAFIETLENEKN